MQDLKLCVCGKIIKKADKYCDKCKSKQKEKNSARNKAYDKHCRDEKTNAFYHSSAWKKLSSIIKIKSGNTCELCFNNNVIKEGKVVHHIVPIKEAWSKRLSLENCIMLCAECHGAVHSAYNRSTIAKEEMQRQLFKIVNGKDNYC
jgi:5-methylcytosine-specific restriction endonuclease McrA|nr:MAG TPA: HNH endonuclease [Caudoviricetes sp.]